MALTLNKFTRPKENPDIWVPVEITPNEWNTAWKNVQKYDTHGTFTFSDTKFAFLRKTMSWLFASQIPYSWSKLKRRFSQLSFQIDVMSTDTCSSQNSACNFVAEN